MQATHDEHQCYFLQYVGKVGTVHRITERGDVRVQYEGCSNRWTFHAGALTKVSRYQCVLAPAVQADELEEQAF